MSPCSLGKEGGSVRGLLENLGKGQTVCSTFQLYSRTDFETIELSISSLVGEHMAKIDSRDRELTEKW